MAEADLSRIVGLIMENPTLIEEIRSLTQSKEKKDEAPEEITDAPELGRASEEIAAPVRETQREAIKRVSPEGARRRELLCALKPYVSEGRSKAIDSIISIAEILEVVRR